MADKRHPDLTAYLLGEGDTAAVERHLSACTRCQAELTELRRVNALLRKLPVSAGPEAPWKRGASRKQGYPLARLVIALAGLAALAVLAGQLIRTPARGESLVVEAISGECLINGDQAQTSARLNTGGRLETGPQSTARVVLPNLGQVDLGANSKLRLVQSNKQHRRFALDFGRLSARVTAPPRLFVIDTPVVTAVDLGCAYELSVDPNGATSLEVTSGWVVLESPGFHAYVAAGMKCETDARQALTIPVRVNAPRAFQAIIRRFEVDGNDSDLETVLSQATADDALTLWHLFFKASSTQRGKVFDRLASFVAPPAGVSRAGILGLDKKALDLWREEVAPIDDSEFWK